MQPERATAVAEIAGVIEHMILSGQVQPGDALPAERQLAVQLGVARLTLRQAIARLVARGLIAPRHGSGNIVLDISRTASPAFVAHLARAATTPAEVAALAADLLAIRRALAGAVLERLATRTFTARELAGFDGAIAGFEAAAKRADTTSAEAADRDHGVVAALVELSRLDVARLFLNPVFSALQELPVLRDAIYTDPMDNVTRWRAVGVWLRTKHRVIEPLLASLATHDAGTVARLRRSKRKP